ncbi:M24 family metallopeptidase [Pleionea mediterranea]|uniref:Xaa-Pro aminopeptidase n=1 Tax=Pleionea mediterranea TaxID=523701 RepID=A0A316FL20_9GAMM|nr:M24 family metallopeptidase [Pleionea mediterranea]PWK49209.1 Xaa-Pro aminopeptidase [Pleionea mediterranea]
MFRFKSSITFISLMFLSSIVSQAKEYSTNDLLQRSATFDNNELFQQGLKVDSLGRVLSPRERIKPINDIVKYRLDHLLPELMRQSDLDMWIVINREYGEDALFYTLVPQPTFAARRTTILVFARKNDKVERFSVSRYAIGDFYPTRWQGGTIDSQWQRLAELVAEYDPEKIGINTSQHWALADGLTTGLHQQLRASLPKKYVNRLTSAESLVVRWLETRTEPEINIYPHVVKLARRVIAEAFSRQVITPGITTADDVAWYIRERFESLGLTPWFQPSVSTQRMGDDNREYSSFFGRSNRTILPGDILHTDVGICYLNLCTDTQEMAYVAKMGETELPTGIKVVMAAGNLWQDSLTAEFKTGLSGNEILDRAKSSAASLNLNASIYTHPIGFVGHASGPTIGMWDNQNATPVKGDWLLYPNTAYAIEGNVKVQLPEWNNQWIQVMLEQTALYDGNQVYYVGGRQTEFHFVH